MTWGHVTSVKAVASASSTPRNQVLPFERGPTVPFFPASLPFSPHSCSWDCVWYSSISREALPQALLPGESGNRHPLNHHHPTGELFVVDVS